MRRPEFQELVNQLPLGKRLPAAVYIHRDAIPDTPPQIRELVSRLAVTHQIGPQYNLIKFHTDAPKVTFLEYPRFFDDPHPSLARSRIVDLVSGSCRSMEYADNLNPPILHRKETFLPANHPRSIEFANLTSEEEEAGLYENSRTIGFRLNWERLLAAKGLDYSGHKLIRRDPVQTPVDTQPTVDRHRTALTRFDLSKPIKTLFEHGLLRQSTSVFDYGCGPGTDVAGLVSLGYSASGWDPVYRPGEIKRCAEVVNLGYVLNVIDDPAERIETLVEAWSLTQRLLVVSALIKETVPIERATTFADGVLTNRNTFQKFFDQHELQTYIEDALEQTAIPVALGIFYVFRDPADLQSFLVSRTKRSVSWGTLGLRVDLGVPARHESSFEKHRELLENFFEAVVQLGRLPLPEEYERYPELHEKVGPAKRALRLLLNQGREQVLSSAQAIRRADTLVYLASSNLRRRVPFKHQPPSIRADIKTFFGDYKRGLSAGLDLLFASGDTDELEIACEELKLGWQDEQALYVHISLLKELPPILRAYVACAESLYGDASQADLVKLHKSSGKVTFLVYDDFAGKPLPQLRLRIKVNLRSRWVQVYDHSADAQLLYYKERFLHPEHPNRSQMIEVSDALGRLGFAPTGFIGPTKAQMLDSIRGDTATAKKLGLT